MRRLAIIDLNTGHQPISNEDGTVWIVFNGEIYNYQELRERLIAAGPSVPYRQRYRDTDPPLRAGGRGGAEAAARDVRLRHLGCAAAAGCSWRATGSARSRSTTRSCRRELYFASEISCLRIAGVPVEPDPEALRLYFQFNYIPDPMTAYKAIRRLPAAGWMTWENGVVKQGKYWECRSRRRSTPGVSYAERWRGCARSSMKACACE